MKKIIIALVVIILIGLGAYIFTSRSSFDRAEEETTTETQTEPETVVEETVDDSKTVIGQSVEGREITAYHFGAADAETNVLLVGGIHGGYEWNTALVAYEAMDYFESNPDAIPENVRVTVIPVLNPDGLNKVVGTSGQFEADDVSVTLEASIPGRFNANNVDLNRNFDCDWQAKGTWQSRTVNGGTAAFSEPESQAIRNYVESNRPDAVIVYYSAANGVFASNCHNGTLAETKTLTNVYADASGYKAYEEFNFYEITGDMVNWLAKEEIPAISVLLETHTSSEWGKNEAGIKAVLEHYAK